MSSSIVLDQDDRTTTMELAEAYRNGQAFTSDHNDPSGATYQNTFTDEESVLFQRTDTAPDPPTSETTNAGPTTTSALAIREDRTGGGPEYKHQCMTVVGEGSSSLVQVVQANAVSNFHEDPQPADYNGRGNAVHRSTYHHYHDEIPNHQVIPMVNILPANIYSQEAESRNNDNNKHPNLLASERRFWIIVIVVTIFVNSIIMCGLTVMGFMLLGPDQDEQVELPGEQPHAAPLPPPTDVPLDDANRTAMPIDTVPPSMAPTEEEDNMVVPVLIAVAVLAEVLLVTGVYCYYRCLKRQQQQQQLDVSAITEKKAADVDPETEVTTMESMEQP